MSIPDPFEPLRARGVAREVWEARGYVAYYGRRHPRHDPEIIRQELGRYELSKNQAGFYTRYTNAARDARPAAGTRAAQDGHEGFGDGVLIHKYAVPGAEPVLPQLRPRYPVEMDKRGLWHRHDEAFAPGSDDLERHLESEHTFEPVAPHERHRHDAMAKYLFPPVRTEPVSHDHATDPLFRGRRGKSRLRVHLRSAHGLRASSAANQAGIHFHTRPMRGEHVADRLDIHPWALERLHRAERVYFVIEGALKADAILSRIVANNDSASVFDVPSVTLWHAPELRDFAREHLQDKLVVVVPDADWRQNVRVVTQALLCREFCSRYE